MNDSTKTVQSHGYLYSWVKRNGLYTLEILRDSPLGLHQLVINCFNEKTATRPLRPIQGGDNFHPVHTESFGTDTTFSVDAIIQGENYTRVSGEFSRGKFVYGGTLLEDFIYRSAAKFRQRVINYLCVTQKEFLAYFNQSNLTAPQLNAVRELLE